MKKNIVSVIITILFVLFLVLSFTSYNNLDKFQIPNTESKSYIDYSVKQYFDTWNTSNSIIRISFSTDLLTDVNAGSVYNLTASFQSINISSNLNYIWGINLEIRFIYFNGEVVANPIHFNPINESGLLENGSTQINIPTSINATSSSDNTALGRFDYNLHYYEYLTNNNVYNYSTGWTGFSIVTVHNAIPISSSTAGSYNFQGYFIGFVLIGIMVTFIIVVFKTRSRKDYDKQNVLNSGYNNGILIHSGEDIHSKDYELHEQQINPEKGNLQPPEIHKVTPNKELITNKFTKRQIPKFACPNCNEIIKKTSQFCPECGVVIDRCNICQLPIEKKSETSHCPHCNKIFHFTHLQESVKLQGSCPVCKENLQVDQITLDTNHP